MNPRRDEGDTTTPTLMTDWRLQRPDEADRRRLIHDAVGLWVRLDVLVNNAGLSGVIAHADLRAATSEIWHALYDVDMVARGARIGEGVMISFYKHLHGADRRGVDAQSHVANYEGARAGA